MLRLYIGGILPHLDIVFVQLHRANLHNLMEEGGGDPLVSAAGGLVHLKVQKDMLHVTVPPPG